MSRISQYLSYPLFVSLVIYGMFYRITSSELWPVTISRTWLHPERFEFSMLQKPLLTFILSFFHIFQLSDVTHLLFVKMTFSLIAVVGLYYYFTLLHKRISEDNQPSITYILISCAAFILTSLSYQQDFFSIRSDQVACVLFIFFLYFSDTDRPMKALACLGLIPFFGVKESIFILPGLVYIIPIYYKRFTSQIRFYIAGIALSALVWLLALNVDALVYLYETYRSISLSERYQYLHFKFELPFIILSWISCLYLLVKFKKRFLPQIYLCLIFSFYALVLPQAYSFFLASLILFIYTPLILAIETQPARYKFYKIIFILIAVFSVQAYKKHLNMPYYDSIKKQLEIVSKVSEIIHQNKLSYLDGVGILPRQNFIACFVSPFDEIANTSCLQRIKNKPDVIIITGRLSALEEPVWKAVQEAYFQVLPNTWVLNELVTEEMKKGADLKSTPLPIFEFR